MVRAISITSLTALLFRTLGVTAKSPNVERLLWDGAGRDVNSPRLGDFLEMRDSNGLDVQAQALSLITSMESAPSCSRLSTATLIISCSSLGGPVADGKGSSREIEVSLDRVKSIYAARLALCELKEAHVATPLHCSNFEPVEEPNRSPWFMTYLRSFERKPPSGSASSDYDDVSNSQLGHCLKALESRPQWWTSYSNARQNAVIICQAVRSDIERDDLLHLHKAMAGVQSDLTRTMAEAEQRSSHHLRNQETFAQSVRAFQEELLQDLKSAGNAVKTTFGKLLEEVNSAVQSLTVKVRANAQAAESDLDVLNDNIKMSANDISDLRAQLAFVFQELLRGGSELASSQQQEGEVALRTASDIRQYLAAISDEDVRYLEVAFGRFRSHLDWSLDSLRSLHTRQMVLEERLTNFDEAFGIIEQKADAFQTSQDRHASTQLEMQQSFQSHMYLTHDILDRMAASAHSLRTTVDETSEKVKQMGLLNGLGVFLGGWGWLLIIVFGLNMLNKAVAGYVAVATGIVYLIASADLGSSFVHHLNVRTTKLSSLSRTNGDLLFHGGTERGVAAAFGLALLVAGGYLIGRLIRVHCPNIGLSRALQRIRRTTGGKRTAGKHNGEKAKSKAFEGLLKSSHDHV